MMWAGVGIVLACLLLAVMVIGAVTGKEEP